MIKSAAANAVTDATYRHAPVDAAECREKVGRCRTQRKGADENTDHQAHVAPRPGGGELHADRVDAGHRRAGDEAQHRRDRCRGIDGEEQRVGDRADERRPGDQSPWVDAIREAEQRASNAAEHETGLHAARERRLHEARQPELRDERGHGSGSGEPQRHRADPQIAMIAIDARFWAAQVIPELSRTHIFGNVTPC